MVRPRTGLQDMFIELDPGTEGAGEFEDGEHIPLQHTQTQVNLDEVLEALDGDTQAYLRALFVGGGQGLKGRGRDLGKVLGTLGPINEKLARLNRLVSKRRENLANVIHDLDTLSEDIGDNGQTLAALVDSSNSALGAIASQDLNVRQTIAELPSTLQTARATLDRLQPYAALLGPTFNNLRPFARNLDEMNASVRAVADTYPVIRDEIRPFVRAARAPVRDLRPAASDLARTTPRLTDLAYELNRLGNMAAYNPHGAQPPGAANRDEGYLYWAGWLGHNGNSVFQTQDGNGLYRRIYLTASCQTLLSILSSSPLAPIVTPFQQLFPPSPGAICP
jgi:phospholipid/cholesterol/gamma-HCH transport system substrate-binding protein